MQNPPEPDRGQAALLSAAPAALWLGLTPTSARHFVAAVATVAVFGFTFGLMFPLLAMRMEQAGMSAGLIGVNSAMQPLGILFSGFIVPPLVARFGARVVVITAALLAAALILTYPFAPILWAWFGLRFLHGLVSGVLFSVSETWVVGAADGPWRSRLIAIYATVLACSFGAGPGIIAIFGINGVLPFAIGAVVLAAATIPVLLLRDLPSHTHAAGSQAAPPPSIVALLGRAPILLSTMAVFGIFDAAVLSFLPLYGLAHGAGEAEAALMLTVLIFGSVLLQLPIGWLADTINKRRLLMLLVLNTGLGIALLPLLVGNWGLWPVLVIVGAASTGLSTLALAEMGERFRGPELVACSSAFATLWGLGALAGSLGSGAVMDRSGPDAFPLLLAGVMALFLAAILLRERAKRRQRS